MENFIKFFDFFGVPYTFRTNGKIRNASWKGGLLSFSLVAVVLIYVFVQFISWINLQYFSKSFQYNFQNKPELNLVDHPDFLIAFCVGTDKNSTFFDPIVNEALNKTLEWTYNIREPWLTKKGIDIPLEQCKIGMFPNTINRYSFRKFENCKCASHKILKDYNISFAYTDSYSTFLSYNIKFKDYIYQNETLYDYYYQYLKKNPPRNLVYYVDTIANLADYSSNVFTTYINYQINFINPDFYYNSEIYLNKISVSIDDSFFDVSIYLLKILEVKKSTGMTFEKSFDYFAFFDNNISNPNNLLLTVRFRASNRIVELERFTIKIDAFIGTITSFIIFIIIIIMLFTKALNEFEAKRSAIMNIFKNFEINNIIMNKIRFIQENMNEVHYNDVPNFVKEVNESI